MLLANLLPGRAAGFTNQSNINKKIAISSKSPELDHTLVIHALLAGLVPVFFITNRQKVEMTGLVNILANYEIDGPTQLQVFLIIFQNVKLHFLIHY